MKKFFEEAEIEVVKFSVADVITTSVEISDSLEQPDFNSDIDDL